MLPDDLALRSRPVGLEPGAELLLLLLLLLLAVEEEDEEVIEGGISSLCYKKKSKINDRIKEERKVYKREERRGFYRVSDIFSLHTHTRIAYLYHC